MVAKMHLLLASIVVQLSKFLSPFTARKKKKCCLLHILLIQQTIVKMQANNQEAVSSLSTLSFTILASKVPQQTILQATLIWCDSVNQTWFKDFSATRHIGTCILW